MGVLGLQTYIKNSDVLKIYCFRDSKLIIDGLNLCYRLYFESSLDQVHGGDYEGFEKIVTLFFSNLRLCSIEPYVVLDGGDDASGKKFETNISRRQERLKRANAMSRGHSGEILPILTENVFKQILRKLAVPFIQCLAEADWEVAALANEWNCPVLSNDSDFYIYSLKCGFLPITHFQWRKVSLLRRSPKNNYIPTKSYHIHTLCNAFNRMNKYHLPLCATILGNDYTKLDKSVFPNFSKFSTRPGGSAHIDGLLIWLSRFPSPKEAITALLSPLGRNRNSASMRKAIYQGMAEYSLNPSSIAQFFMSGEPQIRPPGPLQNLPDWTLKPLAEGKLDPFIIQVLTRQSIMLNIQVEDFGLSSSNETSQLIRQVTYGVLLFTRWQKVGKRSTSSGEEQQYNVEEYNRQGMRLTSSMVPAFLPSRVIDLHLDSLWESPEDVRLQILLDALCVSPVFNSLLIPANLQLAVYVTGFWLNHAQPEPTAEMFWALLINLVYGHLCREHQTATEAGTVILRIKNLQDRKGEKHLDLELAHAYCQWLSCLKCSLTLNQLLNHPVPNPDLVWLYNGPLVHAVAHELMRGVEPESLLAGASLAVELYRNLQATLERELDNDFLIRMRTRAGPRGRRVNDDPADNLSKIFKHLMANEEDNDDGDKIYEETCSVRTRHVSRGHIEDPRAKKYERVKWC
ncbi:single-strand DNA endonuclease ASTE1-like isoform 1-T1 [Clarias gariepinus]|uniref:protein asteroid homolog 1-like isoform X1 n=2 Tax=Clarias gariepinus TaxID=13013 RepID=UPI00234CBC90|nr:protein asteroid homolog 1-like isoform X1 [Clarias gariepinus]